MALLLLSKKVHLLLPSCPMLQSLVLPALHRLSLILLSSSPKPLFRDSSHSSPPGPFPIGENRVNTNSLSPFLFPLLPFEIQLIRDVQDVSIHWERLFEFRIWDLMRGFRLICRLRIRCIFHLSLFF